MLVLSSPDGQARKHDRVSSNYDDKICAEDAVVQQTHGPIRVHAAELPLSVSSEFIPSKDSIPWEKGRGMLKDAV